LNRKSKGVIDDFFSSVLRDGMEMETHLDKNVKGITRNVRPRACATFKGSNNACDVVGTFFIASDDTEPKYPRHVPDAKVEQLATFMKETGARFGILVGQISSSRYRTDPDPEMIRIYHKPPQYAMDAVHVMSLDPINDSDSRFLCGKLGIDSR
jgi:hypothetical protein